MIYHIAYPQDWNRSQAEGVYRCASLADEGFIHCSNFNQIVRVANFLFKDRSGLYLLAIGPSLLSTSSRLKYEGETAELFPHVYGPINLDAIVAVHEFSPQSDGNFSIPEGLVT